MEYTFTKNPCDIPRLEKEIRESAITIAIDHTILFGDSLSVFMKATLSGAEETILNSVVASHTGEPLIENIIPVVSVKEADTSTGGLKLTPKFAPDGWQQQYFETEFETCNSGADSIHEKNWLNVDIGYSSLKFYKVVEEEEVECTDQTDIDAHCIRTDLLWMPPCDYAILRGKIAQKVVPSENCYVWGLGADLDAAYGGPQSVFAEGGINLTYLDSRTQVGMEGVSATILYYVHPQLGAGAGTNRIRFVVRHPVGFRHRLQIIFGLFREPA
jgi:hypothetical protein